ncbi:SusC/RagA family TonB-linked outer membrane protein [Solitalea longa]|nr:SusC/RagA family TonB-linked outer membrane protein [Solitalea longa]
MRITTLILIMAILQVSASSFAQKITISKKKAPLIDVLSQIRTQTGYDFIFNSTVLQDAKEVSLDVKDAELDDVLKKVFEGQPLEYEVVNKTVVVTKVTFPLLERFMDHLTAFDIRGVVLNEVGMPMEGANVKIKGTTMATNTNENGEFFLSNVDKKAVLVISFIGYETKEITVTENFYRIQLVLKSDKLEEITVNAGYYSIKDSERTGSIAKITAAEIEKQPVTNVLATMQGRLPGVNVTQTTGMPGGGFAIEIRGKNSLRFEGNDPLYIIDGVPYSSQDIGSTYTSGNIPGQNSPLNSINPNDVASIEVLKDADATAIYGSRGANGVVLITTKKGKEGKATFSANYSRGFGEVAHFMDVMKTPEYLAMRREAFANDGVTNYPANAYDVNGTWDQNRNTNWQKELIGGTANYTNVQTSVSGGNSQTQYLLSGNYSKETTVLPGDFEYIKGNGHFNLNHESENKKFKINFTGGYTIQRNNLPALDYTRTAITLVPNAPALYDAEGNLNWENNTFDNPLAQLEGTIKGQTKDLITNLLLSYDIGAGFTAKTSFGYTDLQQSQNNIQPSTIYNPAYGLGSERSVLFTNTVNRNSWIAEPQINWNHVFGKGKIDALAGVTFQQQNGDQLVNLAEGFASNSLIENPASATNHYVLNSDESVYKYQAFFGRINWNWDSKYIVNITGRRDGSSRFGPGRQYANFGAIGAAWLFSNEKFIKENLSFLSFGKIRGSYGITGNDQIGDYQYLDTYATSGNTYQGIGGLQPTRLFNPDFGWETNKKLELALETGFWNDRIFTTMAWYRNRSSSQLVGIPLPGTTGFSEIQANLDAEVQNSGFEFSLRTSNFRSTNFSWTSTFNLTWAQNKLLSFPGLEGSTYKYQYVVGQPINITKVYHYTGLNPNTGVYQFEDFNVDGKFSAVDDKQIIKNLSPQYYGGFQNQLRYRNIQLDFLFQFVKQEATNENYRMGMPGTMVNQPEGVTEHWQSTGDLGPYQSYSNSNTQKRTANSRFFQSDAAIGDASYIRLKNVSISYDVPKSWTQNILCKLSLQGQNLLTITPYKGMDPELIAEGYLPPLRVVTASLQITF